MNKIRYYGDFVIYPAIVLALMIVDFERVATHPLWWLTCAFFGFIVWTLAEYWIHRSLLHGPYWMGIHEYHHKHPKHLTIFPWYQLPGYFTAIGVAIWVSSGEDWIAVYAGFLVGWIAFFVQHHMMHHHPEWDMDFAMRHNAHHKMTTVNYGITTDLWDRVFGTYRETTDRKPKG